MVAIHAPIDKTAVYTPIPKTCRATTRRGMIRTPKAWVRINDLSTLWPEGQFRREAIAAAKKFVSDMQRQGLDLITAEADILVRGPLRHRDLSGAGAPTWRPAPGASASFKATGFDIYEDHNDDSEDFLLRAEFLARKVHMVEYRIKDGAS